MYISGPSQHGSSDTLPRWTQRILVPDPHGAARGRGGGDGDRGDRRDDGGDLTARDSFIMHRAKTDLTHERSSGTVGRGGGGGIGRSRLPIFVSNENARIWLDLGGKHGSKQKSNSLDALDDDHHYVNVAPPRPPKFRLEAPRRSTPVYVNVYSLGRRKPGDVIRSGR
jgi:hypothetical protein